MNGNSFFRSPMTGDFTFGDGTALRMMPGFLGLPEPSLFVDASQLRGIDFLELGFAVIGDHRGEVPAVTALAADLKSRYDVDLITADDRQRVLGGYIFEDPHPDAWWDPIHAAGGLVTIVGDATGFAAVPNVGETWEPIVRKAVIGSMRLAVRAYPEGVGTAAPGQ